MTSGQPSQQGPLGTLQTIAAQHFPSKGLGWLRDTPDHRDLKPTDREVAHLLDDLGQPPESCDSSFASSPPHNLQPWPPVEDQGAIGASSVHACIALVQYFEKRATGRLTKPSRLFLYKTARQLMQWTGDTGISLRTTLKAMVRFGIPPEQFWPYEADRLDQEPPAALFSYAPDYRDIQYVRLDPPGSAGEEVLRRVKSALYAGFPCVFGLSVHDGIGAGPEIPWPTIYDSVRGGQAVVAVAYEDQADSDRASQPNKGRLIFRNSWGPFWGYGGYGFLSYDHILAGWATDFWTLIKPDWIARGDFKCSPFADGDQ